MKAKKVISFISNITLFILSFCFIFGIINFHRSSAITIIALLLLPAAILNEQIYVWVAKMCKGRLTMKGIEFFFGLGSAALFVIADIFFLADVAINVTLTSLSTIALVFLSISFIFFLVWIITWIKIKLEARRMLYALGESDMTDPSPEKN